MESTKVTFTDIPDTPDITIMRSTSFQDIEKVEKEERKTGNYTILKFIDDTFELCIIPKSKYQSYLDMVTFSTQKKTKKQYAKAMGKLGRQFKKFSHFIER